VCVEWERVLGQKMCGGATKGKGVTATQWMMGRGKSGVGPSEESKEGMTRENVEREACGECGEGQRQRQGGRDRGRKGEGREVEEEDILGHVAET